MKLYLKKSYISLDAMLCLIVLGQMVSCANKNPENPEETDDATAVTSVTTTVDQTSDSLSAKKFPVLTNANAEAFLQQYFEDHKERKIAVTTRVGTFKVRLYDETPLHTANFLMLAKRSYFDDTEFTRVVKDFVVQGGNNDNETEQIKRILIGNYQIRPEMKESLIHKRGALAMARQYEDNPDKNSSAYDFYFVHGRTFNEPQLMAIERENNMTIPDWKRAIYTRLGGAPHLDGQHTVFGEIYEGFDVLDKMASVETDASNWPNVSLIMKMEVIHE